MKKIEGSSSNCSDEDEEHSAFSLSASSALSRQCANTQFTIFRGLGVEDVLLQKGLAIKLFK